MRILTLITVLLSVYGCAKVSTPVEPEDFQVDDYGAPGVTHQTPPTTTNEPFNIELVCTTRNWFNVYSGVDSLPLYPHQKQYILDAVRIVEGIVVEGLPDYLEPRYFGDVDDLLIGISVERSDPNEPGRLANAKPYMYRNKIDQHDYVWPWQFDENTGLPIEGYITLYTNLVNGSHSERMWRNLILHEIFHCMGFVTPDLERFGGIERINGVDFYGGGNAILGYRDILYREMGEKTAFAIPDLRVPMHSDGAHWKAPEMQWDVMQPSIASITVLSKVTLGALADLGYTVDMTKAEKLPTYLTKPAIGHHLFCDGHSIHAVTERVP